MILSIFACLMKKYTHLFFDLDKTLWDFDKNSEETLKSIFNDPFVSLHFKDTFEEFHQVYCRHNLLQWELYRKNDVSKEELALNRFLLTLNELGIYKPEVAEYFSRRYVELLPSHTLLMPGTMNVLEYLSQHYALHIITNGFEELQYKKMRASGIDKYFNHIITSEMAACKKPDPGIFLLAIEKAGANAGQSLMIGDDYEVDIMGARAAGIDQVFYDPFKYNPSGKATWKINNLKELMNFL